MCAHIAPVFAVFSDFKDKSYFECALTMLACLLYRGRRFAFYYSYIVAAEGVQGDGLRSARADTQYAHKV